jgi:hypothetical protein
MRQPTTKHREFSIRSILFGAIFVTALAAAIFIDVTGLFDLVKGSSVETLEMGAMITVGTVVPMLAMGASISLDQSRAQTK